MVSVASVLGHGLVAGRLVRVLGAEGATAARLTGPSGSGKSFVATEVQARWERDGGLVIVASGDAGHSSRPLHPLTSATRHVPAGSGTAIAGGTKVAMQAATATHGLGLLGGSLFELLSSARKQRTERALGHFARAERDWLLLLRKWAGRQRVLLVAENAHWWDLNAAQLLADVFAQDLQEAIPELANVRLLVVDTVDALQPPASAAATEILTSLATDTETLSWCDVDTFPLVLRALGSSQELPRDIGAALHTATGGHLRLAAELADSLSRPEAVLEVNDLVQRLLINRLGALSQSDRELNDLVSRAAVLGHRFNQRELTCITDAKRPSELRDPVQRAIDSGFLMGIDGELGFAHESLWQAVRTHNAPTSGSLYAKLADCLALLRPGDYGSRATAHLAAGEEDKALEFYALAAIAMFRQGVTASISLARLPSTLLAQSQFVDALHALSDAYAAIQLGDFKAAGEALAGGRTHEPGLVAAERAYASAICAMESQTSEGVQTAANLLDEWSKSLEAEPELRIRFLLLRIQVEVLGERFDQARQFEQAAERLLAERTSFDPGALRLLRIQGRRSAALHSPEIARIAIAEAVEHFDAAIDRGEPEATELYRSLTNLAAVEIRLGQHERAVRHTQRGEQIAAESAGGVPRLDVLANNAVLALLRAGEIDAPQAVSQQTKVAEAAVAAGDGFIQQCNLAGMLLLASEDGQAGELLAELQGQAVSEGFTETYLLYYLENLQIARLALTGSTDEALARLAVQRDFIAGLKWVCAPYVRRRQELLPEILGKLGAIDGRHAADRALIEARPFEIGPAWDYYGRVIPLCELSYWSDS